MLFYASVFISSAILALVALWLYRAVLSAGSVVYSAMLPSAKAGTLRRSGEKNIAITDPGAPVPWGWKGTQKPADMARTQSTSSVAEIPWGWPGNESSIREHGRSAQGGGDLKSYVKRQVPLEAEASHSKTSMQNAGKPWGW